MSDVGLISSTGKMFKDGAIAIGTSYSWILWLFVGFAAVIIIGVLIKMLYNKKTQWTHKLEYRRELPNGQLTRATTIKMRRFPLIKRAEVFELETSLLGSFLITELDSYTSENTFSIIIGNDNRIYKNTGETFDKDKSCVMVSAKHAEIDLGLAELKAKYQNVNKVNKRVEWGQIAKYAAFGLLIIAGMIVALKGLGAWSESQEFHAQQAAAEAEAWRSMLQVMEQVEANTNGQILLTEKYKEIYGTNNIQGVVNQVTGQ